MSDFVVTDARTLDGQAVDPDDQRPVSGRLDVSASRLEGVGRCPRGPLEVTGADVAGDPVAVPHVGGDAVLCERVGDRRGEHGPDPVSVAVRPVQCSAGGFAGHRHQGLVAGGDGRFTRRRVAVLFGDGRPADPIQGDVSPDCANRYHRVDRGAAGA